MNMVERWSRWLTYFLVEKDAMKDEYVDICRLGIEVFISTCITSLGILLIGAAFGYFIEAVTYCLCFTTIRNYSGGYHASSRIRCNLGSWLAALLVIISRNIFEVLPIYGMLIGFGLVAIVLMLLAPLENKNKPLTGNIVSKNRKWMIFFVLLWDVIAVILYGIRPFHSMTIFYTEVTVVILIIIEKGRQENEKKQKQQIM